MGSGNITYAIGDETIHNGSIWQKAPNTLSVISVNSQTGDVVLNTSHIAEQTNLYYTDARSRSSLSTTAPLAYNSGTGAFSIPMASTTVSGYLSTSDWNTFNGKQAAGDRKSVV